LSLIKIFGDNNDFSDFLTKEKNPEEVTKLAIEIDKKIIMEIIEELNKIEDKIKYHHYPWILLELFIVKLTQGREREQLQNKGNIIKSEIKKQPTVTKQEEQVTQNESSNTETVSPQNEEKVSSNSNNVQCQFNEIWPKVLAKIKDERIALYAFLSANSEAYLEDNQLMIGFQPDCLFHKESLEKRENKDKVEAILKEETNIEIKLNCFVTANVKKEGKNYSNPELEKNKTNRDNKNEVIHEITEEKTFDNEVLEKARDLFGGNIFED